MITQGRKNLTTISHPAASKKNSHEPGKWKKQSSWRKMLLAFRFIFCLMKFSKWRVFVNSFISDATSYIVYLKRINNLQLWCSLRWIKNEPDYSFSSLPSHESWLLYATLTAGFLLHILIAIEASNEFLPFKFNFRVWRNEKNSVGKRELFFPDYNMWRRCIKDICICSVSSFSNRKWMWKDLRCLRHSPPGWWKISIFVKQFLINIFIFLSIRFSC